MEDQIDQSQEVENTAEVSEPVEGKTEQLPESQTESEEVQIEDDSEEIDYEGEKYKVPKALKEAFLRQSDYTKKTQEVAEQRRALEANQQQFQQRVQMQQQRMQDYGELSAIDMQLKQYEQIDWNGLIEQNPQQYMMLQHQRQDLLSKRNGAAQRIQQIEAHQAFEEQQATAKRFEACRETLTREIPNWAPGNELDSALDAYAKSHGFTDAAKVILETPKAAVVLHKAYLYDQMMKKATSQPAEKPQAKPITKVSARSEPAKKDPDKMSTDEWLKWRDQQLKAARK